MPLWIIVETAAVKTFVAVGHRPFDDVVKHAIVQVELECDGIVEPYIFVADAVTMHRAQAERDDLAVLPPDKKPDLVRNPPPDFAQKFLGEFFELERGALEDLFVERIDFDDVRRSVGHDFHGDRRPRPFGSAQLSPNLPPRPRTE